MKPIALLLWPIRGFWFWVCRGQSGGPDPLYRPCFSGSVAHGNRRGADAPPGHHRHGDLDVADNNVNQAGADAPLQTSPPSVCFQFAVSIYFCC